MMTHHLENSVNFLNAPNIPLKFSLTSFIQASTYCDEQYFNCEASRVESKKLIKRLFTEQVALRNALGSGLETHFNPMTLNCFDIQGQFDHAVCSLRFNKLEPSQFFIQTHFYKANKLVAITNQDGCLAVKYKRD